MTVISGTNLIANLQTFIANSENANTAPIIKGLDSANNEIANGYVINLNDVATENASITIFPISGTFGAARELNVTYADTGHTFEANNANEDIEEESIVELSYTTNTAAFTTGTTITQSTSGANGIISAVNSTVITVNGSFGTFDTNNDITYGTTDTANVINVNVANSGANGTISTSNSTKLVVQDITGEFNVNKKLKGTRTNAIVTIDTSGVTDTGVSDVCLVAADYPDISSGNVAAVL